MRRLTGVVWAQAWFKLERFAANSPLGTDAAPKIDRARCPLWVSNRHREDKLECPLYPPKANIERLRREVCFGPKTVPCTAAINALLRIVLPNFRQQLMWTSRPVRRH
jgi:hypothetical protein